MANTESSNTILYDGSDLTNELTSEKLLNAISEFRKASDALRQLHCTCTKTETQDILNQCVLDLINIYDVKFAFFGTFPNEEKTSIKTEIFRVGSDIAPNFEYSLKGTPCEQVLDRKIEYIEENVADLYPEDLMLKEQNIESYFAAPLITSNGETIGIVGVLDTKPLKLEAWSYQFMDLYASRIAVELERVHREADRALSDTVFHSSIQAIVITDDRGNVIRVNEQFENLTGFRFDEVEGKHFSSLLCKRHNSTFLKSLWRSMVSEGQWQGELWGRCKSGLTVPTWQTMTRIEDDTKTGGAHYVSIFSDNSERKKYEETLFQLAHYDSLTQLLNREAFTVELEKSINHANQSEHRMALMFMDIDHFKHINDALGHRAGDELLSILAERLKRRVANSEVVARLAGDEFVIIIPQFKDDKELESKAKSIIESITQPVQCARKRVTVTASIGICTFPEHGTDSSTLLNSADTAMYQAKSEGRNTFRFYSTEMEKHKKERWKTETDLRNALENDEFFLMFQPLINNREKRVAGFEALIRWQHPIKGLVMPDGFISIAEDSGLIEPMGEWVIQEACAQLAQWNALGYPDVRMSVNVSCRQFQNLQFANNVRNAIEAHKIQPNNLELEITESVMMDDIQQAERTLKRLKEIGVTIAIDDFGTGFSSLSCLRHYPIDRLKIDRSFVQNIIQNPEDQAIVKATLSLAKNLNIDVITEGVETVEQLNFLTQCGCHDFQGYYFSKPLITDKALDYLDNLRSRKLG